MIQPNTPQPAGTTLGPAGFSLSTLSQQSPNSPVTMVNLESLESCALRQLGGQTLSLQERAILEITAELSNLDSYRNTMLNRQNVAAAANIAARRIKALKSLTDILDRQRERTDANAQLQLIATVLVLFKDVMSETGLEADQRELLIKNILPKIEERLSKELVVKEKGS